MLREFLLKLGYTEDEQSRRKFVDGLQNMTLAVASLGAAAAAAAAGVIAGVAKMADSFEGLKYMSDRTKSSIGDIKSFQYAMSQVGLSAEAAQEMLERFGAAVAANPGFKQMIEHFTGQQYTDAASGLEQIGEAFKQQYAEGKMSLPVIYQIGEQLHLSQTDMQALMRDFQKFIPEYQKMAAINPDQNKMGQNAVEFMRSLRALSTEVSEIYNHVSNDLAPSLTAVIMAYKQILETNAPKIIKVFDDIGAAIDKLDIGRIVKVAGTDISSFVDDIERLDAQFHTAAQDKSGMGQFLHILEEILTFMNSISTNKLFTVLSAILEGIHVAAHPELLPKTAPPPDLYSRGGGALGGEDPAAPLYATPWSEQPIGDTPVNQLPPTGFVNFLNDMVDQIRKMLPSGLNPWHNIGTKAVDTNDPRVKEAYRSID